MQYSPQVSIVMSAFNAEAYVREAVTSLLDQSFHDFELIVINDGSEDDTGAILHSFQDVRIKVVDQPNRGVGTSLNLGCDMARGEFIARLDADDVACPRRLELQASYLLENEGVGLLGGGIEALNAEGQVAYTVYYPPTDAEIRRALPHRTCFAHSAVMMRKEAFDRAGGYRRQFDFVEDHDLWLRMIELTNAANLREIVCRHRIHHESASQQNIERQAIVGLAAKAAARMRRISGKDDFDGMLEITAQELAEVGVRPGQIRQAIALAYLRWANTLLRMGKTEPGLGCFLASVGSLARKVPSPAGKPGPALAGSYHGWREPASRVLIVLWRLLTHPGASLGALAKIVFPSAGTRRNHQ